MERPFPLPASVADAFGLGDPIGDPVEIAGGGVHRLWRLQTSAGQWAVKDLRSNPDDPVWLETYLAGWPLERQAMETGTVGMPRPVLTTDGRVVAAVPDSAGGQRHVRVHEWIDGRNPSWTPSAPPLAYAIGATLAHVHHIGSVLRPPVRLDSAEHPMFQGRGEAYWRTLASEASHEEWAPLLTEQLAAILRAEATSSRSLADGLVVLSHRDINPKNVVIRTDDRPLLVDWDAAGAAPAHYELAAAALTWAGIEAGEPDLEAIRAVLAGYRNEGGPAPAIRPHDVAGWVYPWLVFSDFNVRRLLGRHGEIDDKERAVARQRLELGLRQIGRFSSRARHWGELLEEPSRRQRTELMLAAGIAAHRRVQEQLEARSGCFDDLAGLGRIRFSTTGRTTGKRHEKWWIPFGVDGDTVYLVENNGPDAQWVKNVRAGGPVEVWGQDVAPRPVRARGVTDPVELHRARHILNRKMPGMGPLIQAGYIVAFDAPT